MAVGVSDGDWPQASLLLFDEDETLTEEGISSKVANVTSGYVAA